jgi:hypothetical protein
MNRLMWTAILAMSASTSPAAEWRFGGVFGANLASLEIEGVPDSENQGRTRGALGAVIALRPSDSWSIEFRPGYTGGGAKVVVERTQAAFRAGYLDVPILFTRDLTTGSTRPYLLAGFAFSHLSSAKVKLPTGTVDIKDDFEGSDASFRIGAGLRASKSMGQPFIEVEYARGFKNLNSQASGLGADVGAIRNRGLQIRIGFSAGLN